jgi:hypothetical protein
LSEEDSKKKIDDKKTIISKKAKSIDSKKLIMIKFQSDDGNIDYIL